MASGAAPEGISSVSILLSSGLGDIYFLNLYLWMLGMQFDMVVPLRAGHTPVLLSEERTGRDQNATDQED